MTAKSLLTALLPLVSDLSRELPEGERYRRLLEAMPVSYTHLTLPTIYSV